jgi:iron complex transport system substrate-binding protein
MHAGRTLTVTALLLATALLTACGGPTGDGAAPGTTTPGAGPSGPVTVKHRYGETTLPGRPQKIVALDLQWTDVLAALGQPPAAYAADPTTGTALPWQEGRLGAAEIIPAGTGIPWERLIDLAPDLIVATWAIQDESEYRKLTDIAPTIPLLSADQVDSWQDIAAAAGQVLGVPDKAAALVENARRQTAEVRRSLPGLAGKTFAMANYVAGDGIWVVADPKDGSSVFFDQLGLAISPTILARGGSGGRVKLSLENAGLLDSDLLVLFTSGNDPRQLVGYDGLPSVRKGSAVALDYPAVVGLNTPSPLSIPYSLERIRPALTAAAQP